ncbi:MAG: hypothetical protein LBJ47_09925 [Tannerella sp.]|jgi:hypothetical protein|nr:hypothetical protein [Tannerella sp.]
MKYNSTKKRAQAVRRIVEENYEPGRNDRSKMHIYRTIIKRQFGISASTFFSYLKENDSDKK